MNAIEPQSLRARAYEAIKDRIITLQYRPGEYLNEALVSAQLSRVQAATLLIVGDDDAALLQSHRAALRVLTCSKRLEVVPGAGLWFDELGARETVAHLAGAWFMRHLAAGRLQ